MIIGSIGYSTYQGLGLLLKDFYDNGIVQVVYNYLHPSRDSYPSWYGNNYVCELNYYDEKQVLKFLKEIDILFILETPFRWEIVDIAKRMGIKFVMMPMHECTPQILPIIPDGIINPSHLDQENYPLGTYIPVPIPSRVVWHQRTKIQTYVHNAGHLGMRGRNGTKELLEAVKLSEKPYKLLVRGQEELARIAHTFKDPRVVFEVGTLPFDKLWSTGDAFIFPERFNGLSLPLQEARAAGMYVMCQDRFPMNEWLPIEGLIPVGYERVDRIGDGCPYIDSIPSPEYIAKKLDACYGRDITQYSYNGKVWAERTSWSVLRPVYLQYFLNIMNGANLCQQKL